MNKFCLIFLKILIKNFLFKNIRKNFYSIKIFFIQNFSKNLFVINNSQNEMLLLCSKTLKRNFHLSFHYRNRTISIPILFEIAYL